MKIFFHSYSGYTPIFKEIILMAKEVGLPVEWGVILYSNGEGYLDELKRLVGENNILYLQEKLDKYMQNPEPDLDVIKDFPVSIYQCIETSKVIKGHISIPMKDRAYQLKLIISTYMAYKEFLEANRPHYIFFPTIESYDSFVLLYLCKEIGITPVIYGHARNLGVSYFTDAIGEPLPPYAFTDPLSPDDIERAEEFIKTFRMNYRTPFEIGYIPKPDEIIDTSHLQKNIIRKGLKFIKIRMGGFEPHVVDRYTLIHNLKIHFHPLTMRYRRFKGDFFYRRFFEIKTVSELPQKFIYYPLQYSPESSINIPAPFFVDQLRVVDLILNSMPPDYYLVVKEHPGMRGERPVSFYKALKGKANVLLADYSLPSIDVIKKASLTISVTGTSCLEAFLLGRPSLHIGRAFFSDWIFTFDSFWNFRELIKEAIHTEVIPKEKIIDFVGRTLKIGSEFYVYPASGGPYGRLDILMNKRNIDAFLKNLMLHINRLISMKRS